MVKEATGEVKMSDGRLIERKLRPVARYSYLAGSPPFYREAFVTKDRCQQYYIRRTHWFSRKHLYQCVKVNGHSGECDYERDDQFFMAWV